MPSGGIDYRHTPLRGSVRERLFPPVSTDQAEPTHAQDPVSDLLPLRQVRIDLDAAWQTRQSRDPVTRQIDPQLVRAFRARVNRVVRAPVFFYGPIEYQLHQQVPTFDRRPHGLRALEFTEYLRLPHGGAPTAVTGGPPLVLAAASGFGKTVSLWKAYFDCLCVRRERLEFGQPARLAGRLALWLNADTIRDWLQQRLRAPQPTADWICELLDRACALPDAARGPQARRWIRWLKFGPPLLLFCDLNHLPAGDQQLMAEALVDFHRLHGNRHRIAVAYRSQSPATDQVLATFQASRAQFLDLEPLEPRFAQEYLRHYRRFETLVREPFRAEGLVFPVHDPEAECRLLDQLVRRTIRRVRRNAPEDDSAPEVEESLVSVPLLMHWVSLLRGERLRSVQTLGELLLAVIEQHREREAATAALTDDEWRLVLVGMVRLALVLLAQDGLTRLTRAEARSALQDPQDGRPLWWLGEFFQKNSEYHGAEAREFTAAEAELVLQHGLFRRDGAGFGFVHDSLIYGLAGTFALRQYRGPDRPLLRRSEAGCLTYREVADQAWPVAVTAEWGARPERWRLAVPFLAGVLSTADWERGLIELLAAPPFPGLAEFVREFCRGAGDHIATARQLDREKFHRVGCQAEAVPEGVLSELYGTLLTFPQPEPQRVVARLRERLRGSGRQWLRLGVPRRYETCQVLACPNTVDAVTVWQDPADPANVRVIAACNREILVWDSSRPPDDPERLQVLTGHTNDVMSVAVLPGAGGGPARIVSGSFDKTVRVWDLSAPAAPLVLTGHTDVVRSVAVLPGAGGGPARIVSGSFDKTVRVWDLSAPAAPLVLTGHTDVVRSVAVLPGAGGGPARIVSGSDDRTVRVWDLSSPAAPLVLTGHTGWVRSVAVLPGTGGGPARIVSGSGDETVRVWDLSAPAAPRVLTGHTDVVRSVAVLPGAGGGPARIVSGSDDRTVRVWDLSSPAAPLVLTGHTSYVTSVAVLPGAGGGPARIVSGSRDRTVRVWDLSAPAAPLVLTGHTDVVRSVAVLPGAGGGPARIVSGSEDRTVRVWDLSAPTAPLVLTGHTESVKSVAVLPGAGGDPARIVSGSWDKTVRVWDLSAPAAPRVLTGHTDVVRSVAVLPGAGGGPARIVSGSDDRTVRVWDLSSPAAPLVLTGHTGWVRSVAVLPGTGGDPARIVSGSGDQTVRVWDLSSPADPLVLTGHTDDVDSVAVLPGAGGDPARIVSGSWDQTVRVWDLATETSFLLLTEINVVALATQASGWVAVATPNMLLVFETLASPPLRFVADGQMTAIAFHPTEPILAVGFANGEVVPVYLELDSPVPPDPPGLTRIEAP